MIDLNDLERRLLWAGASLVGIGTILAGAVFGLVHGISFLAGGLLAAVNLALLRHAVSSARLRPSKRSNVRVLVGYFLRLLLIPLFLYVSMRFFFLSVVAAVAGFAVFNCSIFIEGVLEAFKSSSK